MSLFRPAVGSDVGFTVVAGPDDGLTAVVLAEGTLPAGDAAPPHVHHGDEVVRVLEGEIEMWVGDESRRCTAGETVVIPADVLHGFTTALPVRLLVVSAVGAGHGIPVREGDAVRLAEVFRRDLPWGRPPPSGVDWTGDAELAALQAASLEFRPPGVS